MKLPAKTSSPVKYIPMLLVLFGVASCGGDWGSVIDGEIPEQAVPPTTSAPADVPPVVPSDPPVVENEAPVEPSVPPVAENETPVVPSIPPVTETETPIEPSVPPVVETPPEQPSDPPVAETPPVQPSVPSAPSDDVTTVTDAGLVIRATMAASDDEGAATQTQVHTVTASGFSAGSAGLAGARGAGGPGSASAAAGLSWVPGWLHVDEGGTNTFRIRLSAQPTGTVTVNLSSDDTGVATVSPSSLSFTTGNWSNEQTVTITGVHDNTDYLTSFAHVTASPFGGGYNSVPDASIRVVVLDDETIHDVPGIRITEPNMTVWHFSRTASPALESLPRVQVEEGQSETFKVSLLAQPTGNVTVSLSSDDTGVATVSPASLSFTSGNYSTPQTVTVTGVDDSSADTELVKLTLTAAGGGYSNISWGSSTYQVIYRLAVEVKDPDPVSSAGLTVSSSSLSISGSGTTTTFNVKLNAAPSDENVSVAVESGDARIAEVNKGALKFTKDNWDQNQTVTVTARSNGSTSITLDPEFSGYDNVANSTVSVTVTNAGSGGSGGSRSLAGQAVRSTLGGLARSMLDGADTALGSGGASTARWQIAGQSAVSSLTATPAWSASDGVREQAVSVDELLQGSRFAMPLSAADGWTLHGQGEVAWFGDNGVNRTAWLTTRGPAGGDGAQTGVAFSLSSSESFWDKDGESGEIVTDLAAVWPHASMSLAGGGEVQALFGAGQGKLRHEQESGQTDRTNLTMTAARVSGSRPVWSADDLSLSMLGDAGMVRLETAEGSSAVGGHAVDAWRMRGGLEATWSGSDRVRPFGSVSVRHDGGYDGVGSGVEVESGMLWTGAGFSVDARLGWLDLEDSGGDWTGRMETRWSEAVNGQGLSLSLVSQRGERVSGGALWQDELEAGSAEATSSVTTRAQYGMSFRSGVLTPFLELSGTSAEQRQGAGMEYVRDAVRARLGAEHRDRDGDRENRVGLDMSLRF